MENNVKGVFQLIEGLKPVDPVALAEFKKSMAERVIPEILQIIEDRRLFAAQARHLQLTR